MIGVAAIRPIASRIDLPALQFFSPARLFLDIPGHAGAASGIFRRLRCSRRIAVQTAPVPQFLQDL